MYPTLTRGSLLCAVAAELNAYDWTRILPVTDDFVVYATDLELADLDRNMPACLPPSRLATLRERGLLQAATSTEPAP